MLGVPAASSLTTALLLLAGVVLALVVAVPARRAFRPIGGDERLVAWAVAVSLAAVPWLAWRFAEDLSYTTKLDAYEARSAGPIQAYLPGYLVNGASTVIPRGATWATVVGGSSANPTARKAFPSLVLVTLFPRPSSPPGSAGFIIGWGAAPRRVARVVDVKVVHSRQGPLPPVVVGRTRR